jgi:hypothetical protein
LVGLVGLRRLLAHFEDAWRRDTRGKVVTEISHRVHEAVTKTSASKDGRQVSAAEQDRTGDQIREEEGERRGHERRRGHDQEDLSLQRALQF